ncbi:MAG: hypothetical protein Q4D41_00375 [Prevotellaceae bacterium]|nr:hypothetical protein [Prevotellaceae bacterium]
MSENKHQLSQEQYESMLAHVAELGVHRVQTGFGWDSLRKAFNELAETCGANNGINHESTIGRRKILAQAVCIRCISRLSHSELLKAEQELFSIAEDISPRRRMHR